VPRRAWIVCPTEPIVCPAEPIVSLRESPRPARQVSAGLPAPAGRELACLG